ncbi:MULTISPECIES: DUF302 domain-containing protein [unclassified Mesorhizobium]|jgi:uncharacterized protein (DUF302 family)|uniref:DUF302 domain-containing protein n=1 Tax=unclassified Mesorhizobium TaxID=325217 RepID=UPI000FE31AE3|nr:MULTISPECIES: DUF302 domain-containing protein [unclassified Mesorhizobium]MDG4892272.1 DUF302 domain-containing protein [Mesorhizobium sp. WSM4976]RWH69425.1 MAG: DUF302 domain-containing protein [Mesorhizobium sp.]RWL27912.1 MAG: DUF302 domain-containing protein [Mesorhizobium sp.]RWL29221.1 MAG: DUF302 domain-containing protein [Mesorhizobium sp.]RWL37187.1 MAG: DUF302 domain-containing protein [Mesorhizobium sp.]
MSYYFSKKLDMPFAAAIEHVTKKLAGKGFGILTRIDVQHTMKVKLGVDFKPYMILGACNPHFAWRALQAEDKIGAMLPCNVIVTETAPGKTEVAAVDPMVAMGAIDNPQLAATAKDVRLLLREMIGEL